MIAEEQWMSIKRSEYEFITIIHKYKKKDAYNYMPKFEDASILNPNGSKNVRNLEEPKELMTLVQNQSVYVM